MDIDAIENAKENILPAREGRAVKALVQEIAARDTRVQHAHETADEAASFEARIEETLAADGDVLAVWGEYIKWARQTFISEAHRIAAVLQRCLDQVWQIDRYRDDSRQMQHWIRYAEMTADEHNKLDIFAFIESRHIGDGNPLRYIGHAWVLERLGRTSEADAQYQTALKRCDAADPAFAQLKVQQKEFLKRMKRRVLRAKRQEAEKAEQERKSSASSVASAAASAAATATAPRATPLRSALAPQVGRQPTVPGRTMGAAPPPRGNAALPVFVENEFTDENAAPTVRAPREHERKAAAAVSDEAELPKLPWPAVPHSTVVRKENERSVEAWRDVTLKQAGKRAASHSDAPFQVFSEPCVINAESRPADPYFSTPAATPASTARALRPRTDVASTPAPLPPMTPATVVRASSTAASAHAAAAAAATPGALPECYEASPTINTRAANALVERLFEDDDTSASGSGPMAAAVASITSSARAELRMLPRATPAAAPRPAATTAASAAPAHLASSALATPSFSVFSDAPVSHAKTLPSATPRVEASFGVTPSTAGRMKPIGNLFDDDDDIEMDGADDGGAADDADADADAGADADADAVEAAVDASAKPPATPAFDVFGDTDDIEVDHMSLHARAAAASPAAASAAQARVVAFDDSCVRAERRVSGDSGIVAAAAGSSASSREASRLSGSAGSQSALDSLFQQLTPISERSRPTGAAAAPSAGAELDSSNLFDFSGDSDDEFGGHANATISVPLIVDPFDRAERDKCASHLRAMLGNEVQHSGLSDFSSAMAPPLSRDTHNTEFPFGTRRFVVRECTAVDADTGDLAFDVDAVGAQAQFALRVGAVEPVLEFNVLKTLEEQQSAAAAAATLPFVRAHHLLLFKNRALLLKDRPTGGSVQDVVDWYQRLGQPMEESLCVYLTLETLKAVQAMHAASIIHGQFSAHSVFLRHPTAMLGAWNPDGANGWAGVGVTVGGFERAIDVSMYRSNTGFVGDGCAAGYQCIEMRIGKPWTFQIDLYGVCEMVHRMLFGGAPLVAVQHGAEFQRRWRPQSAFKRTWHACALWEALFEDLLNVRSCQQLPSLARHIDACAAFLAENALAARELPDVLQRARMMLQSQAD